MRIKTRSRGRLLGVWSVVCVVGVFAATLANARVNAASEIRIVSVTTSASDRTYRVGDKIVLKVNFSQPVTVSGWVGIMLETGATDRYAGCDHTSEGDRITQVIDCNYTVRIGDRTNQLDYQSTSAFMPFSPITAAGQDVNLSLPQPGTAESLSGSSRIVIDGSGEDEQWQTPPRNAFGLHYALIFEDYRENHSFLRSRGDSTSGPIDCNAVAACTKPAIEFTSVLERCTSAAQVDCIEGVTAQNGENFPKEGEFFDVFPKKGRQEFAGSVDHKIPDGRTSTLYQFKDFPHTTVDGKLVDTYLVTVSLSGDNNGTTPGERKLFASINPVSIFETDCDERAGGCQDPYANGDENEGYRCIAWDGIDGNKDGKITARDEASGDRSFCALRRAFPAGLKFSLRVRLSAEPTGWLHGRLSDPTITYSTDQKTGSTHVVVTAGPVRVPIFAGLATYDAMDKDLQDYYDSLCKTEPACLSPGWVTQDPSTRKDRRMMGLNPVYYSTKAFDVIDKWKEFVKDTSPASPSYWNVRTLSSSEMTKASSCISGAKGVTGIVTTNATAYYEGPPGFDATSKTLKYEVAAPHYEKDGKTEFKGVYNLIVRADVAECLYGFSKAFAAPVPPSEFQSGAGNPAWVEEEPYVDEPRYAEDYPEFGQEFLDTDDGSYEMFEDVEYESVSLADYIAEEEDFTLTEDKSASGEVIPEVEVFEESVVASIDAEIISELQKAANADTTIEMADGWFKFSATNFTFSKPTVKVQFGATPSKVLACIAGSTIRYVKSIRTKCPVGSSVARTVYCVKGKTVDAVVAASPKCPKSWRVAKSIVCARGSKAVRVVALSPKCSKGFTVVKTFFCVKGTTARKVTAVKVRCANGFALATQITCVKGKKIQTVTAVKPACPKGYRKRN